MFKGFGGGRAPAPGTPPRPRLQQQKYQPDPRAGSSSSSSSSSDLGASGFVPNLNTITTSNNLQWMVQPALMGVSPGIPRYPRPYHCPHYPPGVRPRIVRPAGPAFVAQRRHSEHTTPEDEERRRLRRERNKLAAAKCRNRRKELTDTLQAETDQLEAEQSGLRKEIAELQKQKERLELVLETHCLACKMPEAAEASGAEEESHNKHARPTDPPETGRSPPRAGASRRAMPVPANITLTPGTVLEPEALHTPTLMATPSLTPFTPSLVFTYPAPGDPDRPSGFPHEPCSSAHRRSSSSGDHSSDSINSPTLLAL